jgi:hypothetical protein
MPIEIRELIIRTQITDSRPAGSTAPSRANEKEIIERCVEKVLRKLSKKNGR